MKEKLLIFKKQFLLPTILAFIHTITTVFTDTLYFDYSYRKLVIIYKLMVFIVLFIFYFSLIKVVKEKLYKKDYFKIFLFFLFVQMIMLILTWPGVFRNDDINMLNLVKGLNVDGWHHFLTPILFTVELMIIPFPAGVNIINIFVYSIVIAYIIYNLAKKYPKLKGRYLILSIPFLLFPVLENNLYPLRPIIYSYLEIFTLAYIYFNYQKETKLNYLQMGFIVILLCLLLALRSESICYLPLIFIIYFVFVKKHMLKISLSLLSLILILVGFIGIDKVNNRILLNSYGGNSYKLTITYGFIRDAISFANAKEDKTDLNNLNNGFDVKGVLNDNKGWIGGYLKFDITPKEQADFFQSYYKIVLEHFDAYLNERWTHYKRTNGMVANTSNNIFTTYNMFEEKRSDQDVRAYEMLMETNGLFIKPINKDLRREVICFLECHDNKGKTNFLFPVLWNTTWPIIVLLITLFIALFKKQFFKFFIVASILLKALIIFITSPETYFMYYFAIYIIGYIILFFNILKILDKKIN